MTSLEHARPRKGRRENRLPFYFDELRWKELETNSTMERKDRCGGWIFWDKGLSLKLIEGEDIKVKKLKKRLDWGSIYRQNKASKRNLDGFFKGGNGDTVYNCPLHWKHEFQIIFFLPRPVNRTHRGVD